MNSWLKLIGSADEPITGPSYNGFYREENVGFRKERKPAIRTGDRLFLYAPGGSKRIFALAEAVGDPEWNIDYNPMKKGSCRWKIDVRYLINVEVDAGIVIDEVSSGQRNLTLSLRRQSHIKLSAEESRLAYIKLREKTKS